MSFVKLLFPFAYLHTQILLLALINSSRGDMYMTSQGKLAPCWTVTYFTRPYKLTYKQKVENEYKQTSPEN